MSKKLLKINTGSAERLARLEEKEVAKEVAGSKVKEK